MIRFLQSGNKAVKYILGGFLIILAASMVAYLIPGFMSTVDAGGRSGVVATVAGTNIHTEDVNQMVRMQTRGQRVPEFYLPILAQRAAQQLIQQQEISYEADRLGLKVSDQEVFDEILEQFTQLVGKETLFPGGNWIGNEKFEKMLEDQISASGLSVAELKHNVKEDLLRRKFFTAIVAGVNASPAEVEHAYKDRNTKVKFQFAVLELDEIKKQLNPTEAELKAFFEDRKANYQGAIAEKRQVRYFILSDKDAESKVNVDASDLERYYNAHQDSYRLPERVRVRHILIKNPPPGPDGKTDPKAIEAARAKAGDILKQIRSGADFAALAKKESADPGSAEKGGELGWIERGQTVAEFEKKSFEQKPGEISEPVQTQFGFHIIQTEEKQPARVKPFSEVRADIESLVKSQKVGAYLDQTVNATLDLAQKQSLDKAAAQRGAQVVASNPVARADALPGIGVSPDVMAAVFAAPAKSGPQVARYSQGYVIFEVTKIEPPRAPSFEEVKNRVTEDFKTQRARELLQKKVAVLSDRARAEHDLAKAAKEAGATLKTSELVSRTSDVPGLGPMSGPAGAIFALKPGEISNSINLGAKGAVAQVLERQEPSVNDPQFAQQRDGLADQLSEQKRQQAREVFMTELESRLKKDGKLKINDAEMRNLTKLRG
jgi:peptidyl-prolyl cis-trans isomerase D